MATPGRPQTGDEGQAIQPATVLKFDPFDQGMAARDASMSSIAAKLYNRRDASMT
ncbi:hypothetical protein [Burkholderia sp. BCC1972]|uniref:hypothetical protein n=1 Tax=Burkholderia sp. BCC1972 TaxID=2817438 RepID=UPI002ABD6412|nr:hypothetical protein [Burkholderia sp. BCC1972]